LEENRKDCEKKIEVVRLSTEAALRRKDEKVESLYNDNNTLVENSMR
jgi:hypothetical protein